MEQLTSYLNSEQVSLLKGDEQTLTTSRNSTSFFDGEGKSTNKLSFSQTPLTID